MYTNVNNKNILKQMFFGFCELLANKILFSIFIFIHKHVAKVIVDLKNNVLNTVIYIQYIKCV